MSKLTQILFLAIALIGTLWLYACKPSEQSHKYRIALTIAPSESLIRMMLDSTALSTLELKVLLPDGTIPENYEPSIETVSFLERCDAWYYVGDLGFESKWIETVRQLNPNIKLIRLDEGLKHLFVEHSHGSEMHRIADPHYWTSVEGMRIMYRNLSKALRELYPNHIDTQPLDSLSSLLGERTEQIRRHNEALRQSGLSPALIVYHPALTYYAKECGFEQWVIEQDGKEPTPQHMAELSRKWLPQSQEANTSPSREGLNLLQGANPKVVVLREYRDVTMALANTYGLHYALDRQGVFTLDAFSPQLWQVLPNSLYLLPTN